jgi:uncharacterized RDD family membrane protein YckC
VTLALDGMPAAAERVHRQPPAEAPARAQAGIVTRTIAFALDAALIDVAGAAVGAVVALVLSILPVSHELRTVVAAVGAVVFVAWGVAYFTVFWTTTGQTPGNRVMQIRVVRSDGSHLLPRHALTRLFGMVVSVPLFWGYIPILFSDRRRGVFDSMAGTEVVTVPDERGL